MPRPRTTALLAVPALVLVACSTSVEGQAAPGGALLSLTEDADLGYDGTGNTDRVVVTLLDGADRPVVVTQSGSPDFTTSITRLAQGTDPVPVASVDGVPSLAAVAADDTVVVVGEGITGGNSYGDPAVIRVAPDGSEQVLPLQLSAAADPVSSISYGTTGNLFAFTPDASRVLLPDVPVSYAQGFPELQGILQLSMVDTTTGVSTGYLELRYSEPRADLPDRLPPFTLLATALAADGSGVVTVQLEDGTYQLVRFDAALQVVGSPVELDVAPTWITVDDAGTVYAVAGVPVGEEIAGAAVLALPVGATEPETIGEVPADVFRINGTAVARDGTWLYLAVDQDLTDDGDFPSQLRALDTATGAVSAPTALCTDGFTERPLLGPSGNAVLVPAECNDAGLLQERAYVLQA